MATSTRLHQLAGQGQSVWIDFLSRDLLRGGELARLLHEDGVSGVTSNPTIFAKALSGGDAYDEQIAASDVDAGSVFLALAIRDVSDACDLLRPIWERTSAGDGYVSMEVDPNLDEARFFFKQLAAAGVDYDDVVATLEREGIGKFVASINELLKRVDDKRRHLAAA